MLCIVYLYASTILAQTALNTTITTALAPKTKSTSRENKSNITTTIRVPEIAYLTATNAPNKLIKSSITKTTTTRALETDSIASKKLITTRAPQTTNSTTQTIAPEVSHATIIAIATIKTTTKPSVSNSSNVALTMEPAIANTSDITMTTNVTVPATAPTRVQNTATISGGVIFFVVLLVLVTLGVCKKRPLFYNPVKYYRNSQLSELLGEINVQ